MTLLEFGNATTKQLQASLWYSSGKIRGFLIELSSRGLILPDVTNPHEIKDDLVIVAEGESVVSMTWALLPGVTWFQANQLKESVAFELLGAEKARVEGTVNLSGWIRESFPIRHEFDDQLDSAVTRAKGLESVQIA